MIFICSHMLIGQLYFFREKEEKTREKKIIEKHCSSLKREGLHWFSFSFPFP
jgi:hypothetical protein